VAPATVAGFARLVKAVYAGANRPSADGSKPGSQVVSEGGFTGTVNAVYRDAQDAGSGYGVNQFGQLDEQGVAHGR
jgi:hypothetical protein